VSHVHVFDYEASIGPADIAVLRENGFDDQAISTATQVVAYFNYINRIADGLGVPPDDWLDTDGRPYPVEDG
jgi:alkylhydroperoxidase family enzyme